jgi:hypothetical protein
MRRGQPSAADMQLDHLAIAVWVGYLSLWSERPQAGATRPVRAAGSKALTRTQK